MNFNSYQAIIRLVKRPESESFLLLDLLLAKIKEQVALARQLVALVPVAALEWQPPILTPVTEQPYSGPGQPAKSTAELIESATAAASSNPVTSPPASTAASTAASAPASPPASHDSGLLRVGDLLGHLLDCAAGFCALLYSIDKDRLSHFEKLRGLPVNHFCGIEETGSRLAEYITHIEEGFASLEDADLCKLIPTVFVPAGEPILTLLLGNLEHLINHKYQLFIYLRLLGVDVGTKDLYRIRGAGPGAS